MKRPSTIALAIVAAAADAVLAAGASRILPPSFYSGADVEVVITLDPPEGTSAVGVEDSPPPGWNGVSGINNGGAYDPGTHKIKWGPFFTPSVPDDVRYVVTSSINAPGIQCFSGNVSFDGFSAPLEGDQCTNGALGIPATSTWGVIVLGLSLLVSGTLLLRSAVARPGLR